METKQTYDTKVVRYFIWAGILFLAMKSYSAFSGVNDALVQWWWGHNAVGFLLTAGVIGLNYYFIPKVAERPIYSYRLSMINFWGLVGFYTWAGTHHLIYSSIPDWAQSLGIVMSLLLFIPSWAGAFNIYMTLHSNREKLRTDLTMRFFKWAIIYEIPQENGRTGTPGVCGVSREEVTG